MIKLVLLRESKTYLFTSMSGRKSENVNIQLFWGSDTLISFNEPHVIPVECVKGKSYRLTRIAMILKRSAQKAGI